MVGFDLVLGSIAAFYVIMAPYTKVEESFNVQVLLICLMFGCWECGKNMKWAILNAFFIV